MDMKMDITGYNNCIKLQKDIIFNGASGESYLDRDR